VINKTTVVNNVSYNGGPGGITARATAAEEMAAREHHVQPTAMQTQHEHTASQNHALLASVNHGRPAIAATAKPGEFSGRGVTAAHASAASVNRPPSSTNNANHATAATTHSDRPPHAGQSNHTAQSESHANNTNNSHSNNSHPSNEHSNSHPSNAHSEGHEKPGH